MKLKNNSLGAALIEYVLIASLLSIALVGGYRTVGQKYGSLYNKIDNAL